MSMGFIIDEISAVIHIIERIPILLGILGILLVSLILRDF
jgi:hypothetical protein